ncbi:hypothetical protein HY633_04465 [Candidatus Uhrbacteria bacterium]|nr:hypothetical protein [Candidatus Uhrbacteria bacterium]
MLLPCAKERRPVMADMSKLSEEGKTWLDEEARARAMEALRLRKEENSQKEKIDNARLHAGSSMYFYCRYCEALSDTLPESYIDPPTRVCKDCKPLKDAGLLDDQPS